MNEETEPSALAKAEARIAALEQQLIGALRVSREARTTIAEYEARYDTLKKYFDGLTYNADGLMTEAKNTEFLRDPAFVAAYQRGVRSGHRFAQDNDPSAELHIEWRVAIGCWAARHASHLPGDFVECGVNTGVLSLAVCDYIDFNKTGKSFYLFDTYNGIPMEQVTEAESPALRAKFNEDFYRECYEVAKENFSAFPRAQLIKGRIPDTLSSVEIDQVAYLSIDMNIALPERAALEFFWPKLVPGAIILLDDYGYRYFEQQKAAHDEFARSKGVEVFNLPTGQGLIIKP